MLLNLTGRSIRIISEDRVTEYRADPHPLPSVVVLTEEAGTADGHQLVLPHSVDVIGLPEPQPGLWLLVMPSVAQVAAAIGRTDVIAPDFSPESVVTTPDGGVILGVRRFVIYSQPADESFIAEEAIAGANGA